jgi:hypothetical protein
MAYLDRTFPDVKTRRGRMNKAYEVRALGVLKGDPRFEWLVSTPEAINSGHGKLKVTILVELGRIEDDEDLKAIAEKVCKQKPKAKEAEAMVRRWRTGKAPKGDAVGLTRALITCINGYLDRHPDTTWQMVRGALGNTLDAVEQSAALADKA